MISISLTLFLALLAISLVFAVLLVFWSAENSSNKKADKMIAGALLKGGIQNQAKKFFKLTISEKDPEARVKPLNYLCDLVRIYFRMGGTFKELNDFLEGVRLTIPKKSSFLIERVCFSESCLYIKWVELLFKYWNTNYVSVGDTVFTFNTVIPNSVQVFKSEK